MDFYIDVSNFAYMSLFSMGDLSVRESKTGVLFGFLKQVLSIAEKFECKHKGEVDFFFCFDHEVSYRSQYFPEYKCSRKNNTSITPEQRSEIKRQVKILRKKLLPGMGFANLFYQEGFEGDDFLFALAEKRFLDTGKKGIVVTADKDLYQGLDNFDFYSPSSDKYITKDNLFEIYGTTPYYWTEAKIIGGCNSDNVPGIKGAADPAKSISSKAVSYVLGNLTKGKIFDKIVSREGKRVRIRNRRLIALPFVKKGVDLSLTVKKDTLSKKKFVKVFSEYQFQSFLKSIKKWEVLL